MYDSYIQEMKTDVVNANNNSARLELEVEDLKARVATLERAFRTLLAQLGQQFPPDSRKHPRGLDSISMPNEVCSINEQQMLTL